MNFNQTKLTKKEWQSIEIPIDEHEKQIVLMIMQGYYNVNITVNNNLSLINYLKLQFTPQMETHLYITYFYETFNDLIKTYNIPINVYAKTIVKLNSTDKLRMENLKSNTLIKQQIIYEYILVNELTNLCKYNSTNASVQVLYYCYSLHYLLKNTVTNINKYVVEFTKDILNYYLILINNNNTLQPEFIANIITNSVDIIEKNKYLLKYKDLQLYNHQKELFIAFKKNVATSSASASVTADDTMGKLILYKAPTGTGKTLSPLALSQEYKIIFVCAARHIGLELARYAISINKRVAFAFGCNSNDDVRLHNLSAAEYLLNTKTKKMTIINHLIGTQVEIMICDLQSYVVAMNYMLAFNNLDNMVLYWDEPTITLDYAEHPIHELIHQNWSKNKLYNIVLSSATLPKIEHIMPVINDFRAKFYTGKIINISNFECNKSLCFIDNCGHILMPHFVYENYNDLLKALNLCCQNKTLLRYLDLGCVIDVIVTINNVDSSLFTCANETNSNPDILIDNTLYLKNNIEFTSLDSINIYSIKMYYIKLLQNIWPNKWNALFNYFQTKKQQYKTIAAPIGATSTPGQFGVFLTTNDAYTLTDGPTIYITNNVNTIAKFCLQQAKIPVDMLNTIYTNIAINTQINNKISELTKKIENDVEQITDTQTKKLAKGKTSEIHNNTQYIENEIGNLYTNFQKIALNSASVPNKKEHIKLWHPLKHHLITNAFTSSVDDITIQNIMAINGVKDTLKILLLMGIGVFDLAIINNDYVEIMKDLAKSQKLYLIIATSDYIYGTNYQFCHGYFGKDMLEYLTQEKLIQAIGRIGRNNIQHSYSIRLRTNELYFKLFENVDNISRCGETTNREIININKLFNTDPDDMANIQLLIDMNMEEASSLS